MSYPTGMGANTGMHYQNVAAQMHSYMNTPPGSYGRSYSRPSYGSSSAPAIASQVFRYSAQQMGVNPAIANNLGGFARSFVRNVLS